MEKSKYDGYYSIVISEKELSDAEIRNIYKSLWEIEESFKIIKSEFKARPAFVKTKQHVNAYFLICYVTLVIMHTIEHLLKEKFTTKQISFFCLYMLLTSTLNLLKIDVFILFAKSEDLCPINTSAQADYPSQKQSET